MGSNWVINMGVPVFIGVCSQTDSSPASSFSIVSFKTTSISYGTNSGNQTSIDAGQQVESFLNDGNSFTFPEQGLRSFFDINTEGIPVQYSFNAFINGTGIVADDLPTDGNVEVRYSFSFDPASYPVNVYDLTNGQVLETSPQEVVFTGLDRSGVTGSSVALPALLTNDATRSITAPEPGAFADPSLSVEIKILMADGTFITQTQNISTTDASIGPFITG